MGSVIGLITGMVIVTILIFIFDIGGSTKNKITLLISAALVAGITLLAFIVFPSVVAIITGVIVLAAVYALMKNREEIKEAENPAESVREDREESPKEETSLTEREESEEWPAEETSFLRENPDSTFPDMAETSGKEEELLVPKEETPKPPSINPRTSDPLEELDVEEELLAARNNRKIENITEEEDSKESEKTESRNIEEAFELEDIKPAEKEKVDR